MSEQHQDRPGSTAISSGGAQPSRPSAVPTRAPASAGARSGGQAPARGTRPRRTRLSLRRIDPWSTLYFGFVWSLCLGLALVVAALVLYYLLSSSGVLGSVNQLAAELTAEAGTDPQDVPDVVTLDKVLGVTAALAVINVVLLTVLSVVGALLYNAVASFTGGVEITLGDRE